ncbi:SCO2400 family protein [Streptomyces coelicoflavus]
MDYCSSCRRHLNGALVCPGCGAYAPDIAPRVTAGDRVTAPPSGPALARTVSAADDADPSTGSDAAPYAPAADVGDLPPARQQGRAARRRQLTRWKKNKRRAVVASAVALVGGGLSLATMDRQSGDRAQAATAPDHRSMGTADEEITERDRPAPAPTTPEDTHRSSRTPAQPYEQPYEQRQGQSQSSAAGAPRQQSVAEAPRTAPATPPRTTASFPPPATPTPPQSPGSATSTADTSTVDASTADAGSADAGSGRSDSTDGRAPAPSTAGGGASDTSPTPPALISTSPTEVCLLGLCLG